MLEKHHAMVERFHQEITGLPIPDGPTMLAGERKGYAYNFLSEELTEFNQATNVCDQADALIDLIYVAHGRLLEMGIRPGYAFDLVHEANMKKVRGKNKRGSTFEAEKPAGWEPPDWDWFLGQQEGADRGQYIGLKRGNPWDNSCQPLFQSTVEREEHEREQRRKRKKVLLLGYGRHGKDTVAEMLRDKYGLSFTSSSMACAEKVMMPHFANKRAKWFEAPIEESSKTPVPPAYDTAVDCFNDRHNHRAEWFRAIEAFNTPDKSSLGRMIFQDYDIYCGLRSAREFAAVKNSGLYDVCIWVDRSQHVPPEDRSSCTVEPWMADYVLDNNGSLEELAFNLKQLMENVLAS